jgi:hypothetical protein
MGRKKTRNLPNLRESSGTDIGVASHRVLRDNAPKEADSDGERKLNGTMPIRDQSKT